MRELSETRSKLRKLRITHPKGVSALLTTSEISVNAYISQLNRELVDETRRPLPMSLSQRLAKWHCSLPEISRSRAFSMSEIEAALKTQGRYIGEELLRMGWQRKRIWTTKGSYHRYWMPPH